MRFKKKKFLCPIAPNPSNEVKLLIEPEIEEEESAADKTKVLVINRLVKNGDQVEWKSEVVSDPRVINAYLRHRKMIESEQK